VLAAFVLATCASPYDPPQVFDETFKDGRSRETPSRGFGGLDDIVSTDASATLPPRVLWTHGMCTPDAGVGERWWQVRMRDIITAYPGAEIASPGKIEQLPAGASLIETALRVRNAAGAQRVIEFWFLDWTPITGPRRLTGKNDPESPAGNPYRYKRATLNNTLKQGFVKDCLSDVVLYLANGEEGARIRSDTRVALCDFFDGRFNESTGCEGASPDRFTVLIAESLGSSILFDGIRSLRIDYTRARSKLTQQQPVKPKGGMPPKRKAEIASAEDKAARARANEKGMTQALTSLTSFFMLANQVPLIGLADPLHPDDGNEALSAFVDSAVKMRSANARQLTVVAFVDPNDLLSFRLLPSSDHARVVNFVVSNDDTLINYAERPDLAHCNYIRNGYVMHAIVFGYDGKRPQKSGVNENQKCP